MWGTLLGLSEEGQRVQERAQERLSTEGQREGVCGAENRREAGVSTGAAEAAWKASLSLAASWVENGAVYLHAVT